MSPTVITAAATDYGRGPTDRVTFTGCTYHVDALGALHIKREGQSGNVGAFAPSEWRAVIESSVIVASEQEARR